MMTSFIWLTTLAGKTELVNIAAIRRIAPITVRIDPNKPDVEASRVNWLGHDEDCDSFYQETTREINRKSKAND